MHTDPASTWETPQPPPPSGRQCVGGGGGAHPLPQRGSVSSTGLNPFSGPTVCSETLALSLNTITAGTASTPSVRATSLCSPTHRFRKDTSGILLDSRANRGVSAPQARHQGAEKYSTLTPAPRSRRMLPRCVSEVTSTTPSRSACAASCAACRSAAEATAGNPRASAAAASSSETSASNCEYLDGNPKRKPDSESVGQVSAAVKSPSETSSRGSGARPSTAEAAAASSGAVGAGAARNPAQPAGRLCFMAPL
mmetsp:Transcript_25229/g.39114  ORF Transcript_25229/g.39114 Transcript_25229/m.39114 type:complete len:253 (-) Transcript_25229:986-1744(-)